MSARVISVSSAATLNALFSYSPSSPAAGQSVQFSDTSTGTPTSWQWNFGDGGTSTLQNPSHTFTSTGSFTVTLTVRNSSTSDTESLAIGIGAPSTIIPAERVVDWSRAGVWYNGVKGIPAFPVAINVKNAPYNAYGDGAHDDTAAIQAAITACPVGQAVYIPEGTYRLSGTLSLRSNMAVRGAGPDKTKIIQHSSSNIFRLSGADSYSFTNAVSGYAKGSDTIVVESASGFQVGDIVRLDQLNDPTLVTSAGSEGNCNWCGRDGARSQFEDALVTSISGTSIKLSHPVYLSLKSDFDPELGRQSRVPIRNAGVEDLYIESAAEATAGSGVYMSFAAYCWVKNIESYNTARKHVNMYSTCYGCEIRDSYIHGAKSYGGDYGYGISLSLGSFDTLVENNALYHLHVPIVIEAGGAGNVIAYNYVERSEHHDPSWFIYHIGTHGAHPHMNLFEGNVVGKVEVDDTWGSGSHNIFLRNRISRLNIGQPVSGDILAVGVLAWNYYMTFVGNVLGTVGCEGPVEQIPYTSTYDNPVLWKIGYTGTSTGNPTDARVKGTMIRTGNWECPTNAVQWDSSIADHTIPDSLYLTAKPSWFGILAWPPFTPEKSGFNSSNPNKIPAQVRFENGPAVGLPYSTPEGY
jgi:PKD repeat protein